MLTISPNARHRPSPFFEAALAEGLTAVSVYNHMILPVSYSDPEGEYWRLINGVSQWDVGAERQVQLRGPDAAQLAQILTVRNLSDCRIGQGKYAPICNHDGVLLNDPILLKLADDLFWFSIADSDVWLWAQAIAAERGLEVEISEPDASPMAIQGPLAEDVVASVMGDRVRDLRYFWFREAEVDGIPVIVQRSGWSKQGGFEIYLRDATQGARLWNIFREAGKPWDIGPGAPSSPERVESGLVSAGGDTDAQTNPFEVRLGKYVDLTLPDEVVGIRALRDIHARGVARHHLGVVLDGDALAPLGFAPEPVLRDGVEVGKLTVRAWSPRMKANIGFALVEVEAGVGDAVTVMRPGGPVQGRLIELPFVGVRR